MKMWRVSLRKTGLAVAAGFTLALFAGMGPAHAAPGISVSGGMTVNGQFEPLLFTWTVSMPVSGSGWQAAEDVDIVIRGPLNSPWVAPESHTIGTLGADGGGNFAGSATIPYDTDPDAGVTKILRPGLYEVKGVGGASGEATAPERINICPSTYVGPLAPGDTIPNTIDWGHERGGRTGDGANEIRKTFPHWPSTWDERPVQFYGTVEATDLDGLNQPSYIRWGDYPGDHYGHDLNFTLIPDPDYRWAVGTASYYKLEDEHISAEFRRLLVEWETQNDGSPATHGGGVIGLPLFAHATVGDRLYVVGRWILDVGHPENGAKSEMHPPRLVAVMRKRPTVMPLSAQLPNCMTSAQQVDVYVSGHGGGSNRFHFRVSDALDDGGRGGHRIQDVLTPAQAADYYDGGGLDVVGGYDRAAEFHAINDMDYDFDVPLAAPPAGATAVQVEVFTHAIHSTGVNEVITFIDPDPVTTLPRKAHIHLPYLGADNGIYARTFKFAWDKFKPAGKHFQVRLDNILVKDENEPDTPDNEGEWHMWMDISGRWFDLTGRQPQLLDADSDDDPITMPQPLIQDVYLNPGDSLRVFTHGYEEDCFDGRFATFFDAEELGALVALADCYLSLADPGDNEDLGGAVFDFPNPTKNNVVGPWDLPGSTTFEFPDDSFFNVRFTVSYVPAPPRIEVNGVPADFGNVCLGESQDRVIQIFNIGEEDLEVTAITVTGDGFARLPTPQVPFTVAGGEHVDITVRFAPTAITQGTGQIIIDSSDPCQPRVAFDLTGRVIYPIATLSGRLDFGSLPVDNRSVGSSKTLNFYINNAGACPLVINSATIAAGSDPGFAMAPPPFFPQTIQPGESLAVPVLFNPPAPPGPRFATVEVDAANDPTHPSPLTISAFGIGLSPTISALPGHTIFPPTVVGCSRTQTITVFNTGPAELIVDGTSIAGAGYSLSPVTLPIRLAPNASTNLTVTFTPGSVARRLDGALSIFHNDLLSPNPAVVTFCGEGAPIGMRVLVLQSNGTPYATVDQITLSSYGVTPNTNVNLKNVPLTTINPPTTCQTIRFHYETALPSTAKNGPRGSYYNVRVKVGKKAQSVSFTLGTCDFKEIVITLQ